MNFVVMLSKIDVTLQIEFVRCLATSTNHQLSTENDWKELYLPLKYDFGRSWCNKMSSIFFAIAAGGGTWMAARLAWASGLSIPGFLYAITALVAGLAAVAMISACIVGHDAEGLA